MNETEKKELMMGLSEYLKVIRNNAPNLSDKELKEAIRYVVNDSDEIPLSEKELTVELFMKVALTAK